MQYLLTVFSDARRDQDISIELNNSVNFFYL